MPVREGLQLLGVSFALCCSVVLFSFLVRSGSLSPFVVRSDSCSLIVSDRSHRLATGLDSSFRSSSQICLTGWLLVLTCTLSQCTDETREPRRPNDHVYYVICLSFYSTLSVHVVMGFFGLAWASILFCLKVGSLFRL